jgi:NADH dehydrogenase [ubiquinone] 1 alpha subcomplex assembly factor 7
LVSHCCRSGLVFGFLNFLGCEFAGQEFLDAFPVHQFVNTERGWREKLVDIDEQKETNRIFRFVLAPSVTPAVRTLIRDTANQPSAASPLIGLPPNPEELKAQFRGESSTAKVGDGIEISPMTLSTCEDIAKRVVATKGVAILVDYGEDFTQEDSLRGFKNHEQPHVLSQVSTP